MRKRQTFLITVFGSENETASFCGRVKVIATGKMYNFTNLEDLHHLISEEMSEEEAAQALITYEAPQNQIKPSGQAKQGKGTLIN